MGNVSNETLDLVKKAQANPQPAELNKAWVQPGTPTTGLNAYDLEAPAKILYPVMTPLRNMIPRDGGGVGTAGNWRAITGINTANLSGGVSERNRGGVIATSTISKTLPYAALGFEDYVTYEAESAAKTFDDVKARAVEGLLRSTMIYEEKIILGGNATLALGTTATPTLADGATGGVLLANTTYRVICVALTLEGFLASSVANGVVGQVTRTNADGTTDTYGGGSAQQSASATVTTANDSNNTHSIAATVAWKTGAVAFAWYLGTTAGTEKLAAITTINSVVLTAINSSGQLASAITNAAGDNSLNQLVFDGLFAQIATGGSNAYYTNLATGTAGTGTVLTSNGSGGITQIDAALESFWENYKLAPTHMFVGAQVQKNISAKILSGSAPAYRINMDAADKNGSIVAGAMVREYLNPYTLEGNQTIQIKLHPNMPAGMIMFYCDSLPYPLSNVDNPLKIKTRREYYQMEWPQTRRSYDYGVYVDEHLRMYFPPAFGMITNIANG
jgi:hypothetical protein